MEECGCNVCPVCKKCLTLVELKQAVLPDGDNGEAPETPTAKCPMCSCPVVDATGLEQNEKADCIYNKLTDTGLMKRYLQNFDGDFPVSHLKYELSSLLPNNITGRTDPRPDDLGENWMKILINENNLADRPTLAVAKTFIHETIHAEMYRKIKSVNSQISIDDFPGLFDYYSRFENNSDAQHNLMAQYYINIMSDALKEFDSSYSEDIYHAIAWEGLMGTVAWNNKTQNEKNTIINIILQLRENGSKYCNN